MATTNELALAPNPIIVCCDGEGQESMKVEDSIVSIAAHPSQDLLAVGGISGTITLYTYQAGEDCVVLRSVSPGPGYSCRALSFTKSGNRMFSGSSQSGKLYCTNVETGTILQSLDGHSAPLYSMLTVSEKLLASGDETGELKLWDLRSWKEVCSLRENKDFISGLAVDEGVSTLLATSGDGSLTVMDLRQKKFIQRSDPNESELLSLAIVKNEKKVVCGDGEGALMIYNWGLWGDITDRYPIHPQSVDCLLPLNNSVLCTGCMDGWVRAVQILPNQLLGSIGKHSGGFPVEGMCFSHDRDYVVTSSQDSCHFWPVSLIPTLPGAEGVGTEEEEEGVNKNKRKRKRKQKHRDLAREELAKAKRLQQKEFFADLC